MLDRLLDLFGRRHAPVKLAGERHAESLGDGGFEQVVEIGLAHFSRP
jgi:hypothetical protein